MNTTPTEPASNEPAPEVRKCSMCPKTFKVHPNNGSTRDTCSNPCRQAKYRARKALPKFRRAGAPARNIPTAQEAPDAKNLDDVLPGRDQTRTQM
jgi:hypothetical protein